MGLLWMTSVARVALALLHHETFGVEATLATFAVVLTPVAFWKSLSGRELRRQRRL